MHAHTVVECTHRYEEGRLVSHIWALMIAGSLKRNADEKWLPAHIIFCNEWFYDNFVLSVSVSKLILNVQSLNLDMCIGLEFVWPFFECRQGAAREMNRGLAGICCLPRGSSPRELDLTQASIWENSDTGLLSLN